MIGWINQTSQKYSSWGNRYKQDFSCSVQFNNKKRADLLGIHKNTQNFQLDQITVYPGTPDIWDEALPGVKVISWINEQRSLLYKFLQSFVCDKECQSQLNSGKASKSPLGFWSFSIHISGWSCNPADGNGGWCWLCDLVTDRVEEEKHGSHPGSSEDQRVSMPQWQYQAVVEFSSNTRKGEGCCLHSDCTRIILLYFILNEYFLS